MDQGPKTIFITGASGFIGNYLIAALSRLPYNLVVLVRPQSDTSLLDKHNIKKVVGDITDPGSYRKYLTNVDIVFHLAGIVSDWVSRKEFKLVTVQGTKIFYENVKKAGVKRFIYLSTATVMNGRSGSYHSDNLKEYTNSKLPYIKTKVIVDKFLCNNMNKSETEIVIIRPAWVYGPGDKKFFPEIIKLINSGKFYLVGFCNNKIPLIYIDNLISILTKAMEEPKAANKILLAIDKEEITWSHLVRTLADKLNKKVKFYKIPFFVAYSLASLIEFISKIINKNRRPIITRFAIYEMSLDIKSDTSKTEDILSYHQIQSFDSGINKTLSLN